MPSKQPCNLIPVTTIPMSQADKPAIKADMAIAWRGESPREWTVRLANHEPGFRRDVDSTLITTKRHDRCD